MSVTVEIPEEFAALVAGDPVELPRRLLEDAAFGAYCRDAISRRQLQQLLSLETAFDLDRLLKLRGIEHGSYRGDDLLADVAVLARHESERR